MTNWGLVEGTASLHKSGIAVYPWTASTPERDHNVSNNTLAGNSDEEVYGISLLLSGAEVMLGSSVFNNSVTINSAHVGSTGIYMPLEPNPDRAPDLVMNQNAMNSNQREWYISGADRDRANVQATYGYDMDAHVPI